MKIDFNKTVYLRIGGEIGKNHSLPLDYFAELAKSFQNLINNIAEHDLPTNQGISMSNFKIELVDFKKASAVPGFRYTSNGNFVVGDIIQQREIVSERFENLLQVADKGSYFDLRDIYPEPKKRNAMVDSLFKFVDNLKTPRASFVDFEGEEPVTIYNVKRFKKKIKEDLLVTIEEAEISEPEYQIEKVKFTRGKTGRKKRKVEAKFDIKSTIVSHIFNDIEINGRKYLLKAPLLCNLDQEEEGYIIEAPSLGVVGAGDTREEAIEDFKSEFDYLYHRLQELNNDQLSRRLITSKEFFNAYIASIEKT